MFNDYAVLFLKRKCSFNGFCNIIVNINSIVTMLRLNKYKYVFFVFFFYNFKIYNKSEILKVYFEEVDN